MGESDLINCKSHDEPVENRMKIKIGDHLYGAGTRLRAILRQKRVRHLAISAIDSRYAYSLYSRGLEKYNFQSEEEEIATFPDKGQGGKIPPSLKILRSHLG